MPAPKGPEAIPAPKPDNGKAVEEEVQSQPMPSLIIHRNLIRE
jgi:hypothetical protein